MNNNVNKYKQRILKKKTRKQTQIKFVKQLFRGYSVHVIILIQKLKSVSTSIVFTTAEVLFSNDVNNNSFDHNLNLDCRNNFIQCIYSHAHVCKTGMNEMISHLLSKVFSQS